MHTHTLQQQSVHHLNQSAHVKSTRDYRENRVNLQLSETARTLSTTLLSEATSLSISTTLSTTEVLLNTISSTEYSRDTLHTTHNLHQTTD